MKNLELLEDVLLADEDLERIFSVLDDEYTVVNDELPIGIL